MEWLILYKNAFQSEADFVKKIFDSFKVDSTLLQIEQISNLEDKSINLQIKNSSSCVLLCDENFEDKLVFYLGNLIGRVKQFYSIENIFSKSLKSFDNVFLFSDFDNLKNELEKSLPQIIEKNLSEEAFAKLFNDGMPFTPDCFASFIADDNREVCERFITAGIDINCRTKDGTPMLNVALRAEQDDCFDWILTHKVDIDAISSDRGYSAVMDAVWKNNLRAIKILVEKNANLTFISRDGQSILVLAVGIGNPEVCKVLAEAGADPDVKDNMGMSAFEYAKLFNKTEIVSVLEKFHK